MSFSYFNLINDMQIIEDIINYGLNIDVLIYLDSINMLKNVFVKSQRESYEVDINLLHMHLNYPNIYKIFVEEQIDDKLSQFYFMIGAIIGDPKYYMNPYQNINRFFRLDLIYASILYFGTQDDIITFIEYIKNDIIHVIGNKYITKEFYKNPNSLDIIVEILSRPEYLLSHHISDTTIKYYVNMDVKKLKEYLIELTIIYQDTIGFNMVYNPNHDFYILQNSPRPMTKYFSDLL